MAHKLSIESGKARQRYAGAAVTALERELDELGYALYGLTPAEIQLVEERARK